MAATTGQLGLVTPTQGDLSGTWGNTVNNGITEYTNIAIAGTTTFNGDGAVTLVNTTGDASATNIASTSAQYMIVRVTGTLTTAKIITFGSAGSAPYSKLYLVDNAATGGIVTFKAYGQTGVSVAVGEKALVFYNGTDIVKVSGTVATAGGSTTQVQYNSSGVLAGSANLTFDGTNLSCTGNITSGGTLQALGTVQSSSGADLSLNANGANRDVIVKVNGTEQARFVGSTGNLGIGTTSPQAKLVVSNAGAAGYEVNPTGGISGGATVSTYNRSTSAYTSLTTYASAMTWYNGSTRAMDLDASGNLGIGTTSPAEKLEVVAGTGNVGTATFRTGDATAANNAGGGFRATSSATAGSRNARLWLDADGADFAGSDYFYITKVGNGGIVELIQQSSAAMTFQTNGAERTRISAAGGFSVGTTADPGAGAIYATGNITAYYSDARLKTVSGKIENALDKVAQLSGVYYTNNDTAKSFGYDSDEVQVGVIAQEVEAVLPQIVKAAPFDLDQDGNSKSGENYKTVQYDKLVPLLIEAINELQAKVKALKGA